MAGVGAVPVFGMRPQLYLPGGVITIAAGRMFARMLGLPSKGVRFE